jgi:ABC-2 type transport system permease protein
VIETMRGLLLGTAIGSSGWVAAAWYLGIVAAAIPASAIAFRRRTRR